MVVLLKTLENPLDYKEIKPVDPKGNQPWIFIGRIDAEAPILWPPDAKNWLIEKTLMLGKTEGKRRIGQQRMRWLDSITDSMDVSLSKPWRYWRTGEPGVLQSMGSQRLGHDLVTEQQQRCRKSADSAQRESQASAHVCLLLKSTTYRTFVDCSLKLARKLLRGKFEHITWHEWWISQHTSSRRLPHLQLFLGNCPVAKLKEI